MDRDQITIVVASVFPPPIGGVSIHTSNLVRRLVYEGFRVITIDAAINKNKPGAIQRNLRSLARICGEFLLGRRLVWHFHASRKAWSFWLALPWLALFRQRAVFSLHTGDYSDDDREVNRYLRIADKLGVLKSIVVMNSSLAQRMRSQNPELARRIIAASPYVAGPIDEGFLWDVRSNAQSGERGTLRVSTMGLWRSLYRFEDTIDAVVQAARLRPEILWRLDIVASTAHTVAEYREQICAKIAAAGSPGLECRVIENIQNSVAYFATRHIFVRATETDSFGLCVAEAMQAGCVTIATDVCARLPGVILFPPRSPTILSEILAEVAPRITHMECDKTDISVVDGYTTLKNVYELVAKNE